MKTTRMMNIILPIVAVVLLPFLVISFQQDEAAYADQSAAQVESPEQYTVIASRLNVREAPDISSKVIGLVRKGETYETIQTRTDWKLIKLANNQTGWVYSAYLTPAKNLAATVDALVLNVREQPGLSSKIVGKLKRGTKITIQLEQGGWAKMVSSSGESGWVYEAYLTKIASQVEQVKSETLPPLTNEPIQNSQEPLKGKTIVLDPGHGGIDPGTKSIVGTREKVMTLETAKAVEQKLINSGADVIMTRTNDTYIPLEQRANISNQNHADAFISFHYNSSTDPLVNGLTGFYYQKSRDNALASDILNEVVKTTKLNNLGVRFQDLSVLRNNLQPSTLIELGFVSSKQDDSVVESAVYRDQVAQGVYQGLVNYFSTN